METSSLEIKQEGYLTKIFVDDNEISRVRSYELSQSAGEIPVLTLEIMPEIKEIKLDGEIVYKYYDINGNELITKDM